MNLPEIRLFEDMLFNHENKENLRVAGGKLGESHLMRFK
jgi:hypothetical protein